ncbi:MAG: hypothetical protein UT11_C0013G0006 [Berkelbacteria bacterium GW2011_GWA2_38_9]|uniref:Uncharacterized protein n=1 Tax=Berkelbacteria bacterium GW2011_GWA2_38_9 TaxID=1618334 RepID=A0A0G0LG62_9BACT|nr:MAG: hypothetical protein UT11_C0013G0006 [Berkelbacteria bacterium GW2011_GWA2_38_9]
MIITNIPISETAQSRIIKQQSEATIQSFIDAVVEIVTNCDDSYKRLEDAGHRPSGQIYLYVKREKGGQCREFKIKDYAEGMDRLKLEEATAYGEKSSGFADGKGVRGLLGRGLKESIIGLGEGEIITRKNGEENYAKVWWDENQQRTRLGLGSVQDYDKQDEDMNNFIDSKKNGTFMKIKVKNEKIKIPENEKFIQQITDHYAFRDINSSKNREIILAFEDLGRKIKNIKPIKFIPSEGKLVVNESWLVPEHKDSVHIKIWESSNSLTSQPTHNNPFSRAGILIKTKDAILDNHLFKYDNDQAAYYFWGEVHCDGIAIKLREAVKHGKESEIIDLTRNGLNWRSDYCKAIQKVIEEQLTPLIQKKKKELEKGEKKEVSQATKKILQNICNLLDKFARSEFREWEGPLYREYQELNLLPAFTSIEVNKPHSLTIYAPKELCQAFGHKVTVKSDNSSVPILLPGSKRLSLLWNINLDQHPVNSDVYYKSFKVIGKEIDKEAYISCSLGNQKTESIVKVVQKIEEKIPDSFKKKKKGGFISNIVSNITSNPIQRVEYEEGRGEMKIYTQFPGIQRYLTSDLKEIEDREDSRAILAELVGEAFCKVLARKKIETSGSIGGAEGQIDALLSEVNNMQKKYLDKIHESISSYKK